MPQLKPSFIADIYAALEESRFTRDDFRVDLPDFGGTLIRIEFLYNSLYSLSVTEEQTEEEVQIQEGFIASTRREKIQKTTFRVTAAPGSYKSETTYRIANLGKFTEQIAPWCGNIRSDLYAAAPKLDPLEQIRQKLKEDLASVVTNPDDYFTPEELTKVDSRFDSLLKQLSELKDDHALTKQQLETLQKEITEFKQSARAYPKGIWARITGNSLVKATAKLVDSTEGRSFLFKQLPKLLGFKDDA